MSKSRPKPAATLYFFRSIGHSGADGAVSYAGVSGGRECDFRGEGWGV